MLFAAARGLAGQSQARAAAVSAAGFAGADARTPAQAHVLHRGPVPLATGTHERWSKDFVHDALFDGRPFRMLTVVDQVSRQSPLVEPAFAHSGMSVSIALEQVVDRLGVPASITVDHGPNLCPRRSRTGHGRVPRRGVEV